MADPVTGWSEALAAWAIPPELAARASDDPWSAGDAPYRERGAAAARVGHAPDTGDDPSRTAALAALAALPGGRGSVLDVGAGAGAAGLALGARTTHLTAVDRNPRLLAALREEAAAEGMQVETVEGTWPDVAPDVAVHDVVVSHHVLYDVPDIGPFVRALDAHARRRVVIEISRVHPLAWINPLWLRFHGIRRPARPTADDALSALAALGLHPEMIGWEQPRAVGDRDAAVDRARRNLCLPPERNGEVAAALEEMLAAGALEGGPLVGRREVATIWWDRSEADGSRGSRALPTFPR